MLEENCGPRLFDRLLLAIRTYWHWSTKAEREWYSELHLFCCQPGVVLTSHETAEKRLSKTCHCLNCFLSRSQLPLLPFQWEDQQSLMLMGYSFTALIALVHLAQSYFTEMKHLFLVQQPAAAVQWLLYTCPALRPLIVNSSLCVCLPDVFPAHGLGLVPWQVHNQTLSQHGLVIQTGSQGAAGVWVWRKAWWSHVVWLKGFA